MKMSRHCPKYGCIVIYADCLECEDKICKSNVKMKKPKYEIGQTLYIVYECSKDSIIILKANIVCIKIYKDKIKYSYNNVVVDFNKYESYVRMFQNFGTVDERHIDCNNNLLKNIGVSIYPVFTSKEKCKEYIRRNMREKQNSNWNRPIV